METKVCTICGKNKSFSEFCIRRASPDNLSPKCKSCDKVYKRKYRRTKSGLAVIIYHNQLRSSRYRHYDLPDYSKKELKEWLFSNPKFEELYQQWVDSNYKKWLIPSVDRKDDYKPYVLDNIQLMTWGENNMKYHKDRVEGVNNKQNKAVLQYDLQGNFVKEHFSLAKASLEVGVSYSCISKVCHGKFKQSAGYIWEFKD